MRRLWSSEKKPLRQVQDLVSLWQSTLMRLKDSLASVLQPETERSQVQKSALPTTIAELVRVLLQEDATATDEFSPGLEWCLDSRLFVTLAAEAYIGRPTGVFSLIVDALADLVQGVKKQPLLQNSGFCIPISNLFDYVSEQKDAEFPSKPLIRLLAAVCEAVHFRPDYLHLFMIRRDSETMFSPLPLLWTLFLEELRLESPALRQSLLYCAQLEDESLVRRFLLDSEVSQMLVLKLGTYFQTLPHVQSVARSDEAGLEELRKYAVFLDTLCEVCLWPAALSALEATFYRHFCESLLAPRLRHSSASIRSTCVLYLRELVAVCNSKELLAPLVRFLVCKREDAESGGFWVDNLEAQDEELRLRSLQLLYLVVEKRNLEIMKLLFLDEFQHSLFTEPLSHSAFCEAFILWLDKSTLQRSAALTLQSAKGSPSLSVSPVATGETDSSERDLSSTGGDGPEVADKCGELLQLLLRKVQKLESNSGNENLLVTGIFSHLCALPCSEARSLQQFLMGKSQGSLWVILVSLSRSLSYRRTETTGMSRVARATHASTKSSPSFFSRFGYREKAQEPRETQLQETLSLFEGFLRELASLLATLEDLDTLAAQLEVDAGSEFAL